jgi:F-type H+-transporting ATPase subunit gamma
MASLKDTKRRIVSVKNTQKITKAMKLVSAAKFARANQAAARARPYGRAFEKLASQVLQEAKTESSLMAVRPTKKILLVVLATDRGLCGGLNSNILKKANAFIKEKQAERIEVELALWGRRCFALSRVQNVKTIEKRERVLDKPVFSDAKAATQGFCKKFEDLEYDAVHFIFPKFVNAMTQIPQVEKLLPVVHEDLKDEDKQTKGVFLFEPSLQDLSESILRDLLAANVYRYLLDGRASEHAARMTAMDNASNNAKDVIKKLTLEYNRARQANITRELIEITSGAQALN